MIDHTQAHEFAIPMASARSGPLVDVRVIYFTRGWPVPTAR